MTEQVEQPGPTAGDPELSDICYSLSPAPGFDGNGTLFACRTSGLYRSDDRGVTWRGLFEVIGVEGDVPALAAAIPPDWPTNRSIFAATHGGVLRSFDEGRNWELQTLTAPAPLVTALALAPDYSSHGVVFAATNQDGVFRSADRGSRWTAWNFGLLDLNSLCLAVSPGFARDETLVVGTESGIFASTNGGRAWRETGFPDACAPVLCLAMSPGFERDGTLFAGTESCGLYRSANRGRTWERVASEALTDTVNSILVAPGFPVEADLLALTAEGLLVSHDGGGSWSDVSGGADGEAPITAVAAPGGMRVGDVVFAGRGDGSVVAVRIAV